MKVNIYTRKITVEDAKKAMIEKKVSKLGKFFDDSAEANVVISEQRDRKIVELTINSGGMIYRAEQRDDEIYNAVDENIEAVERQIRKNKTRLAKRLRQDALAPDVPAEFDVNEETEFEVVRTKHVAVKPMSVDEAILQMNLLDHDFFVYRNTDNVISIVYRRKSGGYGLLETDGLEQ